MAIPKDEMVKEGAAKDEAEAELENEGFGVSDDKAEDLHDDEQPH